MILEVQWLWSCRLGQADEVDPVRLIRRWGGLCGSKLDIETPLKLQTKRVKNPDTEHKKPGQRKAHR